jgi:4-amino-4-deoxy-L-arabinose transferase-like glycosyltransferase
MKNTNTIRPGRPPAGLLIGCALAAFFLFFFALGSRSLSGSEDRWAEIARNMLLYRDWFHPVINDEVYFDKPLLSYWLIAVASYFTNGLNELSVRLPGAFSALATLAFAYGIAKHLFDRQVAQLTALLMATSYGFLFWSHTASADLSNVALTYAAVLWFVKCKERTDFWSYFVFYLICAVGCQLKGLTALVVPVLIAFPYLMRRSRWRAHLNFVNVLALLLAASVFFLPYFGAAYTPLPDGISAQHNHLSGVGLLIRENFTRFFEPFDHVAPIYSYLYEVPRILFPWMFLFIGAIAYYGRRYRELGEAHRWVLDAIVVIFVFFTLSGSRRWYYILPIMPLCLILVSAYLSEAEESRWRRYLTLATVAVLALAALGLLAAPWLAMRYTGAVPEDIVIGALLAVIAITVSIVMLRKPASGARYMPGSGLAGRLMPALCVLAALEMVAVFGFVLPAADGYRQLKPFAMNLSAGLRGGEKLVFFKRAHTALVFYLNRPAPIPVIASRSELAATGADKLIIVDKVDREAFFNEFPELKTALPAFEEARPLTKMPVDSSVLMVYRVKGS